MQKYTDVVTSARSGSAIPSASVTVKTSPGGVTATIYSDDGVTTQANPLTTDSNGEFTFYAADGEYTLTVSGTGITERTVGPIILHDPADSDDYMPSTDVSFTQSGTGAVSRPVSGKLQELPSFFDFIPTSLHAGITAGTNTDDLTTYIQAAVDAAYTEQTGGVFANAGTFYWTTVARQLAAKRTVNIYGAGTKATVFKKYGAGTDPLLNWSTSGSSVLEAYARFQDFSISASGKTFDGIKLTDIAYLRMLGLNIEGCDKAIHGLGALVLSLDDNCVIRLNAIGLYLRKNAGGTIRPNMVYVGGNTVISNNSSFGIDFGDGSMLTLKKVDMESNGTSADTATGAIMIRVTTDDGSHGRAQVNIEDTWFESNDGRTIQSEAALSIILSVKNSLFTGDEVPMNIGSGIISLENVACPTGTITLAGTSSTITNSVIHTITDTCTSQVRVNVSTNAEFIEFSSTGPVIAKSDTQASAEGGSIQAQNATTPAKWTQIGYDGTADVGYIKAIHSATANKNMLLGGTGAALTTGATGAMPMIPSCAGTPTGAPTGAAAGRIPMIYDTTNNIIYFYNGSWRGVAVT
jgi:hypothetical protein